LILSEEVDTEVPNQHFNWFINFPHTPLTWGIFIFMITETYDGLVWEIDEIPIGSSTPDEFFELSYRAHATCPNGHVIRGTANYWSRDEAFVAPWLSSIEYEPCEECEYEEAIDDFDDELI
jgi:hypothetical protein